MHIDGTSGSVETKLWLANRMSHNEDWWTNTTYDMQRYDLHLPAGTPSYLGWEPGATVTLRFTKQENR